MNNQFIIDNKITNEFVEKYTKTTYRIVGNNKHSAIKPCHWLEQRLMTGRDNRNCYKGVFGVKSHRCLQNSPSMPFCNHQCVFCWRDIETGSLGSEFIVEPDEPKELVDEMMKHHLDIIKNHLHLRRYLDNYEIMIDLLHYMISNRGYHSINSLSHALHVSKNKLDRACNLLKNQKFIHADESLRNFIIDKEVSHCINSEEEIRYLINLELTNPDDIMQAHGEAMIPNHAAISLDGEVMMYPFMSDLLKEFKNRSMTTFIVTNGTLPNRIENLETLPSQLYVTLPAPNEQVYKKTCRPMIKNGWKEIMKTLNLIESLNTRTLIRLTAVKDININEQWVKDYAKLVEKANPDFFEIKGFTLQAKALLINERLKSQNAVKDYFPEFDYLKEIAGHFEEVSGFSMIYSNEASRDFLFAVNWDENKDPQITKL